MKRIISVVAMMAVTGVACAAGNPMFGDGAQNSLSLGIAQSTGSHNIGKLIWPGLWEISPQTFFIASYAQPIEIMRAHARMNIHIMQNVAYESSRGLSFIGLGTSWDIATPAWHGWYIGVGIGPYYRDNHDRWVSSRLVFGEKVFIGKIINDAWRAEFFTQHFSNGDFTETNHGFNYVGMAMNYSF